MMRRQGTGLIALLLFAVGGCDSGSGTTTGVGGDQGSGGATARGGSSGSGGSAGSGGTSSSGGSRASGGAAGNASGGTAGNATGASGGGTASGGSAGLGGGATGGAVAGSGGRSSGGTTGSGGRATGGSGTGRGGSTTAGGTSGRGGSGGGTGTGTSPGTGGATGTGGVTGTGGTTVPPGSCDPGSSTTTWATDCPTAPPATCTAGTWVAGGPDPDHTGYKLLSESEHFAVYSDESPSGAQAAVDHLETVWKTYFGSPMFMREPLCNSATKYKASVHVHSDWGLTGGSWASGRMGMWIGTGGLADHWGLAHEFMHGVQSVQGGQSCNRSNTCGWIYESHANWAPQQLPEYHTTSLHCSELFVNAPHLYLGNTRDRYCNWQFMEYLKDKHCMSAVNAIWTGSAAADPFNAIMKGMGWTVAQLNDFMGEWAMHNIIWDYQDPEPQSTAGGNQGAFYRRTYGQVTDTSKNDRKLRMTKVESLDADFASNRRFVSPFHQAPQRYGYNIVRLFPEASATAVTVTFRGVSSAPSSPDWRWGLVATDAGLTKARYSPVQKGADAELTFCVNAGESLFLVVTATPSAWYDIVWDQPYNTVPRYPYMFQLAGAWPDGFQGGQLAACPSGTARVSNGGGCGPSTLPATVYVGPYAVVTGTGVTGNARIEDHAQVLGGKVTDATVGALTIFGSAFSVSGASTIAQTTFMPLDFFEGRSLSGGALIGDVELRASRSSGTCAGFVDGSTCTAPGTEVTPKPPYAWR